MINFRFQFQGQKQHIDFVMKFGVYLFQLIDLTFICVANALNDCMN